MRSTIKNSSMDPDILHFMYFNGAVVLLLVAYMLFWRPKRDPSRLKLRERFKTDKPQTKPNENDRRTDHHNSSKAHSQRGEAATDNDFRNERELNVIFQFNGHDFDAFEVLGVKAGSSLEAVERSYAELLSKSPEDTREFLQMAYHAIKLKLTRL